MAGEDTPACQGATKETTAGHGHRLMYTLARRSRGKAHGLDGLQMRGRVIDPSTRTAMNDTVSTKKRGIVKFAFWTLVAASVITWTARSYVGGQMSEWFYYRAATNGYAVNVDLFRDASKSKPAVLQVVETGEINGLVATRVKKGDRLPRNTNGVISDETLAKGKRAVLAGSTLEVRVPWEMKDAKGFKFKDTFKHKGVETWPWSGLWNVIIVVMLGLSLGLMAEGFTDMLGFHLEKIQHHPKH
jgi:hypothetical protein